MVPGDQHSLPETTKLVFLGKTLSNEDIGDGEWQKQWKNQLKDATSFR